MAREDVYKNSSTTADILMDQCRILAAFFCVLSSAMPSGADTTTGLGGHCRCRLERNSDPDPAVALF